MEKGEKVAILAIGVNLVMFGIKYFFAGLSGSIALKADAYHSLSDVVASATVLAGLVIARRKSRSFPYGLYKVENLVSVLVAFAILLAGYEIAVEALAGGGSGLSNVGFTIASVLCVIAIAWGYSRYAGRVGREIGSPSLVADAGHIGVDIFSSVAVLAGLLASYTGVNLDRPVAFVIVIIIVWCGGKILVDGVRVLLDASLDYATLSRAEKLMRAEPQVTEVLNLTGRSSGRYKFIEAVIVLKTHELDKAHFIASRIEAAIGKEIGNVDRVLLHYEPTRKETFVYAIPLQEARQGKLSNHFGQAPFFGLFTVRLKDRTVVGEEYIENPLVAVSRARGILVAEFLNRRAIDVLVTRKRIEGRAPFYVLSDAAVAYCHTEEKTARKALSALGLRI